MAVDIDIKPMFPVIRGGKTPSAEFEYVIRGATSVLEAHAGLYAYLSPTYYTGTHTLTLQDYELKPKLIGAADWSGDTWEASANYGRDDEASPGGPPQEPGDPPVITWDTNGTEVHITQALAQRDFPAHPRIRNVYKNAIGVKKDGIDGCDILVPAFKWSEQYMFAAHVADFAYAKNVVVPLVGRTNNAAFRGFEAGEVLFTGATGNRKGYQQVEVSFNFVASPNADELLIAPGDPGDPEDPDDNKPALRVFDKGGHDYLWVDYVEHEIPADGAFPARIVYQPRSAHVAQVYEEGNFALLGIGT